jgi:hypothetical protein
MLTVPLVLSMPTTVISTCSAASRAQGAARMAPRRRRAQQSGPSVSNKRTLPAMGGREGSRRWSKQPRGHHMGVHRAGVGLCGGWQDGRSSATTVSDLLALAGGLGRLPALAPRAAADRADLDSTRPLPGLSTEPRRLGRVYARISGDPA